MTKFIVPIDGVPVEYSNIGEVLKSIRRVPVSIYLELEQHVDLDALQFGTLPLVKNLACWAYLLRRGAGEQVSFQQVAEQLVPDECWIPGEDDPEPTPDPPAAERPAPSEATSDATSTTA